MFIQESDNDLTIRKLTETHGTPHEERIKSGVEQASRFWREEDGSPAEFQKFCLENFYAEPEELEKLFSRLEKNFESLLGNFHRVSRDFYWNLHVETGPMLPVDYQFANFNVFAHVNEDLFLSKIAFTVLLNFRIYSLAEKNSLGENWTRRQWAEARLADLFTSRIPADVRRKRNEAYVAADDYVNKYNLYMHNLIDERGERLFPKELMLISHWGLRDEIKAQYAYEDGLARQELVQMVMERVVMQQVPNVVINSSEWDWNPFSNEIRKSGTNVRGNAEPEQNRRYELLRTIFQAEKLLDQYTPQNPSLIERRFNEERELSESDVESLLVSVLSADVVSEIADLIRDRLGRNLEPFDIWYDGFRSEDSKSERELDEIVSRKSATVEKFQKVLPEILRQLGFSKQKSQLLASHIQVDPARGAGHAVGAMMKEDRSHLRTRVSKHGMDYKGFNTAMHELGHTVEQVFSLNEIDRYFLQGVPNTAFTEAFAFAFQARDLSILGVDDQSEESETYGILRNFWATYEISGVALVDMRIWKWMYENPDCNSEQVREAIQKIAREVWNEFYAPVFRKRDQVLLAVYSHIIDCGMYIPDYPLGHIISFQIEEYLKEHDLAGQMERMCKLGRLAPQIWMHKAVGQTISTEPLIRAAKKAIMILKSI